MQHCNRPMRLMERTIKPSDEEAGRGVESIDTRTYWCSDNECRRKRYYKQEVCSSGRSEWQRVKRNIAAFVARLKLARQSDWVWGYHPETFAKVKRTVH